MPGTRSIDPVIGSNTPRRCASVTGIRSGSTGGSGSMANSRTLPLASAMRMVFGLLRSRGGGGIIGRDQRAVDDAALRGAGAGAAGERLEKPRGAAGGRGRKLIVGDIDGPGAPADGNARQRRLILRLQPALRERRLRRSQHRREHEQQQPAATRPRGKAGAGAGRGEIMRDVVTWDASCVCARLEVSFKPIITGEQRENRAPAHRKFRRNRRKPAIA